MKNDIGQTKAGQTGMHTIKSTSGIHESVRIEPVEMGMDACASTSSARTALRDVCRAARWLFPLLLLGYGLTAQAATAPGAPTTVTAVAGNAQATVSFKAPTSNGGSAITGYTVTSSPAGGVDSNAGTTGLSHIVTGLVNGTAYTFTVKATNAIGTSAASTASASVTPATVPGAPTIGTATGGNAKATITFTPPASNGGSAITSYTATSTPGSKTGTCTALPCSVTGLTNGTAYTFTVKATNAIGTSVASTSSNSVTPIAPVPPTVSLTSPAANTVVIAPASFTLTANATSTTSTISKVEFYNGTTLLGTATAAPYSYTWNSVPVGSYSLTAKATDALGTATTSAAINVTAIADQPPTVSIATPANGSIVKAPGSFTLTASATSTTSTIAKVDFYANSGTSNNLVGTAITAPFSYTWSNVSQGTYVITAVATDALNTTATSNPISVTVNNGEAQAYYIHTDHLDSPRMITDTQGNVVWGWDNSDPFGNNVPNENPSGAGQFSFNLRFAGQYADNETGLFQNRFRDYDPANGGRYIESDPIGLRGGSWSTYAYVNGNPLSGVDPLGLMCFDFNKFANQVSDNRANNALTLGSLLAAEGVGTMPKTPDEMRALGVPKEEINPITNQLSRWSGRFGTRALREIGRTTAGIAAGAIATGAVVFEGFYDWGVIGKAAVDATSSGDCGCNGGK